MARRVKDGAQAFCAKAKKGVVYLKVVYSGASIIHGIVAVFLETKTSELFSQTSTQALHFEHLKPRKRGTFRRPPSHTRDDDSSPRREHMGDWKWEVGKLLWRSFNAGEAAAAASGECDKGHFRQISGTSQHYLAFAGV